MCNLFKLKMSRSCKRLYPSRIPISFHFSHSAPTPGPFGAPLMSFSSNNSYSFPKDKKCAKRELK